MDVVHPILRILKNNDSDKKNISVSYREDAEASAPLSSPGTNVKASAPLNKGSKPRTAGLRQINVPKKKKKRPVPFTEVVCGQINWPGTQRGGFV